MGDGLRRVFSSCGGAVDSGYADVSRTKRTCRKPAEQGNAGYE